MGAHRPVPAVCEPVDHGVRVHAHRAGHPHDRTHRRGVGHARGEPPDDLAVHRARVLRRAVRLHARLPHPAPFFVCEHGRGPCAAAVADGAGPGPRDRRRAHLDRHRLVPAAAGRVRQAVPRVLLRVVPVQPPRPAGRGRQEGARPAIAAPQGPRPDRHRVDRLDGRANRAARPGHLAHVLRDVRGDAVRGHRAVELDPDRRRRLRDRLHCGRAHLRARRIPRGSVAAPLRPGDLQPLSGRFEPDRAGPVRPRRRRPVRHRPGPGAPGHHTARQLRFHLRLRGRGTRPRRHLRDPAAISRSTT